MSVHAKFAFRDLDSGRALAHRDQYRRTADAMSRSINWLRLKGSTALEIDAVIISPSPRALHNLHCSPTNISVSRHSSPGANR